MKKSKLLNTGSLFGEIIGSLIELITKIVIGTAFVLGSCCLNIILTVLIGAISGWVIDIIIGRPIIEFATIDSGTISIYFQQIGAIAGFIIGFFKNHIKFHLKNDEKNVK